ncbi:MAG: toll/interleukin-1 receptor domain-containing protein [Chthoniobacterales bacterium]|nr:toll/interleukin-1 receptor domain-containing protein [Chthoniobacterales bacterium]
MTRLRNFFISYNRADERWAEWIAWTVADAGYTHYFQKWDFRPGGNFVLDMQKAAAESERTLLVLTTNYLQSLYTQPEWAAAFARDPTGEKRLIVPVRVERCEPAGMLKSIVYCDLVDLGGEDARTTLLAALQPSGKPAAPPPFPGVSSTVAAFPGPAASAPALVDPVRLAAQELRSIFATSGTTFAAQARLRDDLSARIHKRLRVPEHHEYEELFDLYFHQLQPDELRLHRTIRAYTESVLHEYNTRALQLLEREPRLADFLPSVPALKQHLILWLNKFDRLFVRTASMCLLYVGVEERVGFPSQIENELEHYLSTGAPAPKIEVPQQRDEYMEERRGRSESYESFRRKQLARLHALEQRIAELTAAEVLWPADEFRREQLATTEEAYARLIGPWVAPGLLHPDEEVWLPPLETLSREVDAAIRPDSSPEVLEAGRELRLAVFAENSTPHFKLAGALPYLVALKSHEQELGLGSAVSDVWRGLSTLFRSRIYD